MLVVGTDGIWDTEASDGERVGKELVYDIVRTHSLKSSQQIVAEILDRVCPFGSKKDLADDVTPIVIKADSGEWK